MLVTTAILFTAIEVGLRIGDFRPPVPESVPHQSYRFEKNRLGFHDSEWTRKKPPGTWRVLVVGDSFTAGWSVPREDLFVERIERSLNERATGGRRFELMNVSQPGWDTREEVSQIKRFIDAGYEPDAVLIVFFINDATNLDTHPEIVWRMHKYVYERDGFLNRHSRLFDWVDFLLRRSRATSMTIDDYRRSFEEEGVGRIRWTLARQALQAAHTKLGSLGIPLGLVIFPVLIELDASHGLSDLYAYVETYCAEIGVPVLNLLPAFYGKKPASLWVGPANSHPNAEANRIAAPAIEEFLIREGIVPDPAPHPRKS
jgi:lysophospholipase L1-like esterase